MSTLPTGSTQPQAETSSFFDSTHFTDAQIDAEGLTLLEEEEEKKRKEQEQQAAAAQQQQQPQEEQPQNNPLQEIGTAVVGAGIDAVEGIGATAEGLVTGQILDPEFKPTWLQVDDDVEPLNQTVWGNITRSILEFGLGFAAAGGVGHLAKASKVPVLLQAGKYLVNPKTTKLGQAGQGIAKSAVATFVNSNSEGDTIANQVKEVLPWFPTITHYEEGASPLEKRAKHVMEDVLIGGPLEILLGFRAGKRAAHAIDEGVVKNLDFDPQKVAAEVEVLKRNIADSADLDNPETLKQIKKLEKYQKKLDDYVAADPDVASEMAKAQYREASDHATRDMVQLEFELDPTVSRPRPSLHPEYFDSVNKTLRTVEPGNMYAAMKDMLRMAADGAQEYGRRANLVTDAALQRMARSSPEMKKQLQSFAEEIQAGLEIPAGQNVGGLATDLEGVRKLGIAKYMDIVQMDYKKADWEDIRQMLLEDAIEVPNVTGGKTKVMNSANAMALEMLMYDLNTAVADQATALHSVANKIPIEEGLNKLLNNVEAAFLMNQEGSEFAGSLLRARRGNTPAKKTASALAAADKKKQISKFMGELREIITKDPEMTDAFLRAFAETNGDVVSMEALRRYASDQIFNAKSLIGGKRSKFVDGLFTSLYNSILSAPKTIARAFSGTNLLTVLRPGQVALGGALSGDVKMMQKGLYMGFSNVWGTIDEAWQLARREHHALVNNLDGVYTSQAITPTDRAHWQSLGAVINARGSDAEKIMYRVTSMMQDFNNQSWVRYPSNAMATIDAFSKTLIGRQELKAQAFEEVWNQSGGKVTKELLEAAEENLRSKVFNDVGKVIDPSAIRAGQEVALQIPLEGRMAEFDKLISSVPMLRPFFMFMKTGANAIEVVAKHTPVIARFSGEVNAILKATPDNLDDVLKYGIDSAEKLSQARALVKGRVATGYMTVGSAVGLYMTGSLSGNGPADRETRKAWVANGWKPRSIKLGDKWVNYDGLEPFASILALIADVGDMSTSMGEHWTENTFGKISYLIASNLTNKSFLSGLQPLSQLIGGAGVGGSEVFLGNLMNNIVPYGGLRNELANVVNPGLRELERDIWDTIRNRNPLLRGTLPMAVDPLDGSTIKEFDFPTRMWNSISPIQISGKDNETRQLLRASGFDLVTTLSTDSNGTPLNPQERSRMAQLMGKYNIEGQLAELFKNKQIREDIQYYRNQRDAGVPGASRDNPQNLELRKSLFMEQIQLIFNNAKRAAEAELHMEYPGILRRGELNAVKEYNQGQGNYKEIDDVQKLLSNENK